MDNQQPKPECTHNNTVQHHKQNNRLKCKNCGKTWSSHHQEIHFGMRTNPIKIQRIVHMLNAQLPIRTIARITDVSAGTVMRCKKRLTKFTRN